MQNHQPDNKEKNDEKRTRIKGIIIAVFFFAVLMGIAVLLSDTEKERYDTIKRFVSVILANGMVLVLGTGLYRLVTHIKENSSRKEGVL